MNFKKVQVEEEILSKLQDQLTNDSTAKYVHKLLRRCKEKNKNTVKSLNFTRFPLYSTFLAGNRSDKQ